MQKTLDQYDKVVEESFSLYKKKFQDYGASWRIMRLESLTDQIFIKAKRIRSVQDNKNQKVADDLGGEFIGIINYSIMALIQLELKPTLQPDFTEKEALHYFQKNAEVAKSLMLNKNHDYGEAWRELRISSITDLILQKLFRIKQIEDNDGQTIVSEGLEANYLDMINYAIFAIILMGVE